jgi:hypothetical protein
VCARHPGAFGRPLSEDLPRATGGDSRVRLSFLLAEVVTARQREREQLQRSATHARDLEAARLNTLYALLDYAEAITSCAWPVPRSIQDDIRMHRSLLRR